MTEGALERSCFVIGPIGGADSDTRKRSDKLLKYIITPTANNHGYDVKRADQIPQPGIITNQIVDRVWNADLLIADLTDKNSNVFYELAIRHLIRKPFIHVVIGDEELPFDVSSVRTIVIKSLEVDDADAAKTELSRQIQEVKEGKSHVENPISISIDLQMMRQSGKTSDRFQADLLDTIIQMQNALSATNSKLDFIMNNIAQTSSGGSSDFLQNMWNEISSSRPGAKLSEFARPATASSSVNTIKRKTGPIDLPPLPREPKN